MTSKGTPALANEKYIYSIFLIFILCFNIFNNAKEDIYIYSAVSLRGSYSFPYYPPPPIPPKPPRKF